MLRDNPRMAVEHVFHGLQVVVMGVAGCGKSTVGRLLADELGLPFVEGDSFHPAANIARMQRGEPLTDGDRAGWLQALAGQLDAHPAGVVLACSALKAHYRDVLRGSPSFCPLYFVHLQVTQAEATARVRSRPGHFYPESLVASQFEALQDPAGERGVLTLHAQDSPASLVRRAADWLRTFRRPGPGTPPAP